MILNIIKKSRSQGFTLVELLVVIALLAAIALAVIAAINPIEQANRARDTRFNADSASLVSAIERYYTARSEFPWVTSGGAASNDSSFGFVTAGNQGVGVCGATCSVDGLLISDDEVKQEFRNRDFIKNSASTDVTKTIMVGKSSGGSASVYGCYVPLAKTNRQKACTDGKVYTLNTSTGSRSAVSTATCSSATADWAASGWYICLPQ
jgi:prepilin-type N-terminal cleavage/methylation domain-containing protein